jgi:EpsI family protein
MWSGSSATPYQHAFRSRWWIAAALVLATAAIWPLAARTLESRVSQGVPVIAEIPGANGWTTLPQSDASWMPNYVGHRAVLHQRFAKGGRTVGLYIAYYRGQHQGAELVNSQNVLVSTRDRAWREAGRGRTTVRWAGEEFEAGTAELERQGAKLQAWHWYWIDGSLTSNDYVATAFLALAKLSGRGDDAAAIVLYAPDENGAGPGKAALEAFTLDMAGEVNRLLERARGSSQ